MHTLLSAMFFGAGTLHFLKPAPFDSIVPPQLPASPRFWTYASGVVELTTATLLAIPRTRRTGGLVSAGLLAAVWPANFYMAWLWREQPWRKQVVSLARLPLQVPLICGSLRIWRNNGRGPRRD